MIRACERGYEGHVVPGPGRFRGPGVMKVSSGGKLVGSGGPG